MRLLSSVLTTAFLLASSSLAFAQATPASGGTTPAAPAKKDDTKPAPAPAGGTPVTAGAATTPAVAPSEQKKEEPKKEGELKTLSGERAVYVSFDIGFTRPDLGGFSDNLGFDKTAANGLLYGIGAGAHLNHLRVGARFRGLDTTEFTLWEIMGEVGWGFGLRPVSPAIMLHAGYAFDVGIERGAFSSQLPRGALLPPDIDVKGLVLGVEGSFPYYLTDFLRLGPFIGFDMLFLSRQKADLPQSILPISQAERNNALFTDSGSGVGYTLNLGIRGSFDVAF